MNKLYALLALAIALIVAGIPAHAQVVPYNGTSSGQATLATYYAGMDVKFIRGYGHGYIYTGVCSFQGIQAQYDVRLRNLPSQDLRSQADADRDAQMAAAYSAAITSDSGFGGYYDKLVTGYNGRYQVYEVCFDQSGYLVSQKVVNVRQEGYYVNSPQPSVTYVQPQASSGHTNLLTVIGVGAVIYGLSRIDIHRHECHEGERVIVIRRPTSSGGRWNHGRW
jgi:hypothetical protein